jgi:hypothetical protein
VNNTELAATDDLGGTNRTFSVPAANLPSGLSLNGSTGAITGTIGAVGTTSVTFRATDNASGATLDRTFSIVGIAGLYTFGSSFTFTNAIATGHNGPTLTNLTDTYTPSWTDNTNYLNVSGGIQEWTVPETGTYQIKAAGAYGVNTSGDSFSGYGAIMRGDVTLIIGSTLNILVGQKSVYIGTSSWQGGAGGTFVAYSNNNPLIVAGGGGTYRSGVSSGATGRSVINANTGTSGNNGTGTTGGINGNHGEPGGFNNQNGTTGSNNLGAGAAGYYENGTDSVDIRFGGPYTGSKSFLNGGVGGDYIGADTNTMDGGFGGGGTGGWGGSGGGGGYSGGGNDGNNGYSGGGGSFISSDMTNGATSDGTFTITGNEPTTAYSGTVTNIGSYNGSSNHGYVIITKL